MQYSILSPAHIESLSRIRQGVLEKAGETGTRHNEFKYIYDLGLGMQETLQFLYSQRPDLHGFLQWANDNGSMPAAVKPYAEDVLTETDLQHWAANGFVVVKEAVTAEEYTAATKAVWEFLGADPSDPESWYRHHPAKNGLMLVFTQHAALHALRNSAKVRKAYEQLYGTTEIYKIVDKLSFNPPENSHYKFTGSPLHWDTSLELPVPDRFQGLLYLNDVTAEGGAFHCVPGFHRDIATWLGSLPAGTDPRQYAQDNLQPVAVPGNAGDLIIWHQALPHCASPNRSKQPRLVQYLTYIPDNFEDHRAWK